MWTRFGAPACDLSSGPSLPYQLKWLVEGVWEPELTNTSPHSYILLIEIDPELIIEGHLVIKG